MILDRVDDPRDLLGKATRYELARFAKEKGVPGITEETPADVSRKILRSRGLTDIKIPNRQLGSYDNVVPPAVTSAGEPASENAIDAVDLLTAEYEQKKDISQMSMNELRAECRARGVKMERRDNVQSLREKLSGKDAA